MKRLLVIGRRMTDYTTFFDSECLDGFSLTYDFIEDIVSEGVPQYVARRISDNFDGVLGPTTDIHKSIAHVIAAASGCNAPTQDAMLACKNKYISRLAQKKCVPKQVPKFFLYTDQQQEYNYPVFIKPVSGILSAFAQVIQNKQELHEHIAKNKDQVIADNKLYEQILSIGHYQHEHLHTYNEFLCEEYLQGTQVSVDGYVFKGNVHIYGIIQAHMLEGTLSFSRWDFPVHIDGVNELVTKLIAGIGLDNTTFNVELMVNDDNIFIIEVHARLSMQFVGLIENVTGVSPMLSMCKIALGQEPSDSTTQSGKHNVCCSCVLRKTKDALVTRVPTQDEVRAIERAYPGVKVFVLVEAGKRLSDYRQDSDTFRYGLITVPGASIEDVERKRKEIEAQLQFKFA